MSDSASTRSQHMEHQINLEPVKGHLHRLLEARAHPKTLCPSEVARALSTTELEEAGVSSWRDLMPSIRTWAFDLRDTGELEILQKGSLIPNDQDAKSTTGPIRIRRKRDA